MKSLFKIWVKYASSGLIPSGIELILLYSLVEFFGLWYLFASAITFSFSFTISFVLRKFWVFKDYSKERMKKQAFLYALVFVFNITANILIMHSLVERFNLQYILAQIISGTFLGIIGFVVNRLVIFKKKEEN
ncbi:MAG: GtrA family protein [bacterium]